MAPSRNAQIVWAMALVALVFVVVLLSLIGVL